MKQSDYTKQYKSMRLTTVHKYINLRDSRSQLMKTIVTSEHLLWSHGDCQGLAALFDARVYPHPNHQDQVTLAGKVSADRIRQVVGEPVDVKHAESRRRR